VNGLLNNLNDPVLNVLKCLEIVCDLGYDQLAHQKPVKTSVKMGLKKTEAS
jgi:hypothetical protein